MSTPTSRLWDGFSPSPRSHGAILRALVANTVCRVIGHKAPPAADVKVYNQNRRSKVCYADRYCRRCWRHFMTPYEFWY